MTAPDRSILKRAAAVRAVGEVQDGMVIGLGTGSTSAFAIEELSRRVAAGLKIVGVPTSERTRLMAQQQGVPLLKPGDRPRLDLTIDGADQVERGSLDLVKGAGGALLGEKIVASASDRMIVIVDDSKIVERLGKATPLPVEIVSFGWRYTVDRLTALGLRPHLRLVDGKPFVSDAGNHIADCHIDEIADAAGLEAELSSLVGVVETGLFLGLASTVIVGRPDGIEVMQR
ncbi:ribose-5-phosphate isomerase [Enhydrobacter aerosaccus]|uniref:Ribose-5-phosphate isomerase A n=1 Tax=Enhydrobacter aerosaccus TaxID=225324 RepID=A0A1T4SQH2_9HYPH|nr:ribose-5-phosphate isomerase RpiA [Enhydrobacter aerosaccus]SKA30396.1 ribose-5-phosphate isomerase [Enhydrobacter aerosaccus]